MKLERFRQVLGALVLLSGILYAPAAVSSAYAGYHTGLAFESVLLGILFAILYPACGLLTVIGGIALLAGERYARLLLTIAGLLSVAMAGPMFIPFMGYLVSFNFTLFLIVNMVVVLLVWFVTIKGEKL